MEQTSQNLRVIATSITEMNAAMGSITDSTGAAKNLSSQAILRVDEMNASLQQLSKAAGDAGRDFGVVATEVKVLSKQTASASTDISGKVRDEQARVLQAVEKMSKALSKPQKPYVAVESS